MSEINIGNEQNNFELDLGNEKMNEVMTLLAMATFEASLTKGKSQIERSVLDEAIKNNQLSHDIEALDTAADFKFEDLLKNPLEHFSYREIIPQIPDSLQSLFATEGVSITRPKVYSVDGQIQDFTTYGGAVVTNRGKIIMAPQTMIMTYDPEVDGSYDEYIQDSLRDYVVSSAVITDVFPQKDIPKMPKNWSSVLSFTKLQSPFTSDLEAQKIKKQLQETYDFSPLQIQESLDIISDQLIITTYVTLAEEPRKAAELIAGLKLMESFEGTQRVGKNLIDLIARYEKKYGEISYTITDKGVKDQKNLDNLQSFMKDESQKIIANWKQKKSAPSSVVNHSMFHYALFP